MDHIYSVQDFEIEAELQKVIIVCENNEGEMITL